MKTIINTATIGGCLLAFSGKLSAESIADNLSGSLTFELNSHFISKGVDVDGGGSDGDLLFNPSFSLTYQINDEWSLFGGTWLDINSEVTGSFEIVETDVWIGASYDFGPGSISASFVNFQFGGESEELIDVVLSFDTLLSPTFLLSQRLGTGALGPEADTGLFGQFSVGHSFDLGAGFSLGLNASVAVFFTEFHTDETGFGFFSIGPELSYAVSDNTSLYAKATLFITDEDTVGNEANGNEDEFVTFATGVSFSF